MNDIRSVRRASGRRVAARAGAVAKAAGVLVARGKERARTGVARVKTGLTRRSRAVANFYWSKTPNRGFWLLVDLTVLSGIFLIGGPSWCDGFAWALAVNPMLGNLLASVWGAVTLGVVMWWVLARQEPKVQEEAFLREHQDSLLEWLDSLDYAGKLLAVTVFAECHRAAKALGDYAEDRFATKYEESWLADVLYGWGDSMTGNRERIVSGTEVLEALVAELVRLHPSGVTTSGRWAAVQVDVSLTMQVGSIVSDGLEVGSTWAERLPRLIAPVHAMRSALRSLELVRTRLEVGGGPQERWLVSTALGRVGLKALDLLRAIDVIRVRLEG